MTALAALLAVLLGAAWRRWFGSERPKWMRPVDAWWRDLFGIWRPDKGAPWRAMQIVLGIVALAVLNRWAGDTLLRCVVDAAAAVGFMTLPIAVSRQPFVWAVQRLRLPTTEKLPHPWKPMLQGPEPWAEAVQGGLLWSIAVLV